MLIDSAILIDYLRSHPDAISFLEGMEAQPAISALTVAELYAGVRGTREQKAMEALFSAFEVLDVTPAIARRGGDIRRRYGPAHGLDLVDALIGATAIEARRTLVTRNVKHFPANSELLRPY